MIRVLVVEDLPTARQLLVEVLRADPEIEVAGVASDGAQGVERARELKPDVITMDILMPRLDGFEATKQILAEAPIPIVIVSSLDVGEIAFSMEALRAGALAAMPKPRGPGSPAFEEDAERLRATVKAMSRVRMVRPGSAAPVPRAPPPAPFRRGTPGRIRAVGIAASTGGPAALQRVLAPLPAGFHSPILVVQHIALGFADGFARWLGSVIPLRVKVAAQGEPLSPGVVYVAPDDQHLAVSADGARVELSRAPPIGGLRPSGTHLFRGMAAAYGASAAGVILTGMGRDGVDGLAALKQAGGLVLAQDPSGAVVDGMPLAAVDAGVVSEVVPLDELGGRLRSL